MPVIPGKGVAVVVRPKSGEAVAKEVVSEIIKSSGGDLSAGYSETGFDSSTTILMSDDASTSDYESTLLTSQGAFTGLGSSVLGDRGHVSSVPVIIGAFEFRALKSLSAVASEDGETFTSSVPKDVAFEQFYGMQYVFLMTKFYFVNNLFASLYGRSYFVQSTREKELIDLADTPSSPFETSAWLSDSSQEDVFLYPSGIITCPGLLPTTAGSIYQYGSVKIDPSLWLPSTGTTLNTLSGNLSLFKHFRYQNAKILETATIIKGKAYLALLFDTVRKGLQISVRLDERWNSSLFQCWRNWISGAGSGTWIGWQFNAEMSYLTTIFGEWHEYETFVADTFGDTDWTAAPTSPFSGFFDHILGIPPEMLETFTETKFMGQIISDTKRTLQSCSPWFDYQLDVMGSSEHPGVNRYDTSASDLYNPIEDLEISEESSGEVSKVLSGMKRIVPAAGAPDNFPSDEDWNYFRSTIDMPLPRRISSVILHLSRDLSMHIGKVSTGYVAAVAHGLPGGEALDAEAEDAASRALITSLSNEPIGTILDNFFGKNLGNLINTRQPASSLAYTLACPVEGTLGLSDLAEVILPLETKVSSDISSGDSFPSRHIGREEFVRSVALTGPLDGTARNWWGTGTGTTQAIPSEPRDNSNSLYFDWLRYTAPTAGLGDSSTISGEGAYMRAAMNSKLIKHLTLNSGFSYRNMAAEAIYENHVPVGKELSLRLDAFKPFPDFFFKHFIYDVFARYFVDSSSLWGRIVEADSADDWDPDASDPLGRLGEIDPYEAIRMGIIQLAGKDANVNTAFCRYIGELDKLIIASGDSAIYSPGEDTDPDSVVDMDDVDPTSAAYGLGLSQMFFDKMGGLGVDYPNFILAAEMLAVAVLNATHAPTGTAHEFGGALHAGGWTNVVVETHRTETWEATYDFNSVLTTPVGVALLYHNTSAGHSIDDTWTRNIFWRIVGFIQNKYLTLDHIWDDVMWRSHGGEGDAHDDVDYSTELGDDGIGVEWGYETYLFGSGDIPPKRPGPGTESPFQVERAYRAINFLGLDPEHGNGLGRPIDAQPDGLISDGHGFTRSTYIRVLASLAADIMIDVFDGSFTMSSNLSGDEYLMRGSRTAFEADAGSSLDGIMYIAWTPYATIGFIYGLDWVLADTDIAPHHAFIAEHANVLNDVTGVYSFSHTGAINLNRPQAAMDQGKNVGKVELRAVRETLISEEMNLYMLTLASLQYGSACMLVSSKIFSGAPLAALGLGREMSQRSDIFLSSRLDPDAESGKNASYNCVIDKGLQSGLTKEFIYSTNDQSYRTDLVEFIRNFTFSNYASYGLTQEGRLAVEPGDTTGGLSENYVFTSQCLDLTPISVSTLPSWWAIIYSFMDKGLPIQLIQQDRPVDDSSGTDPLRLPLVMSNTTDFTDSNSDQDKFIFTVGIPNGMLDELKADAMMFASSYARLQYENLTTIVISVYKYDLERFDVIYTEPQRFIFDMSIYSNEGSSHWDVVTETLPGTSGGMGDGKSGVYFDDLDPVESLIHIAFQKSSTHCVQASTVWKSTGIDLDGRNIYNPANSITEKITAAIIGGSIVDEVDTLGYYTPRVGVVGLNTRRFMGLGYGIEGGSADEDAGIGIIPIILEMDTSTLAERMSFMYIPSSDIDKWGPTSMSAKAVYIGDPAGGTEGDQSSEANKAAMVHGLGDLNNQGDSDLTYFTLEGIEDLTQEDGDGFLLSNQTGLRRHYTDMGLDPGSLYDVTTNTAIDMLLKKYVMITTGIDLSEGAFSFYPTACDTSFSEEQAYVTDDPYDSSNSHTPGGNSGSTNPGMGLFEWSLSSNTPSPIGRNGECVLDTTGIGSDLSADDAALIAGLGLASSIFDMKLATLHSLVDGHSDANLYRQILDPFISATSSPSTFDNFIPSLLGSRMTWARFCSSIIASLSDSRPTKQIGQRNNTTAFLQSAVLSGGQYANRAICPRIFERIFCMLINPNPASQAPPVMTVESTKFTTVSDWGQSVIVSTTDADGNVSYTAEPDSSFNSKLYGFYATVELYTGE